MKILAVCLCAMCGFIAGFETASSDRSVGWLVFGVVGAVANAVVVVTP